MDVEIEFEKSLEKNAASYYEKAKASRKKLIGLERAMAGMNGKFSSVKEPVGKKRLARKRTRRWFESFHWFRSSDGFLVIGGRDAKSNETIVKRHLDDEDVFLHADIPGAASCVIKAEGRKISEAALGEAAEFSAVRSKAWQQKLSSVDVYAVSREQVSKSAPSGEALATGAFMIYGKRQWFRKTPLRFSVGLLGEDGSFLVMAGPPTAVRKNCLVSFEIVRGNSKRSDVAKSLLKKFEEKGGKGAVLLDDILAVLPGEKLAIKE